MRASASEYHTPYATTMSVSYWRRNEYLPLLLCEKTQHWGMPAFQLYKLYIFPMLRGQTVGNGGIDNISIYMGIGDGRKLE